MLILQERGHLAILLVAIIIILGVIIIVVEDIPLTQATHLLVQVDRPTQPNQDPKAGMRHSLDMRRNLARRKKRRGESGSIKDIT